MALITSRLDFLLRVCVCTCPRPLLAEESHATRVSLHCLSSSFPLWFFVLLGLLSLLNCEWPRWAALGTLRNATEGGDEVQSH